MVPFIQLEICLMITVEYSPKCVVAIAQVFNRECFGFNFRRASDCLIQEIYWYQTDWLLELLRVLLAGL